MYLPARYCRWCVTAVTNMSEDLAKHKTSHHTQEGEEAFQRIAITSVVYNFFVWEHYYDKYRKEG